MCPCPKTAFAISISLADSLSRYQQVSAEASGANLGGTVAGSGNPFIAAALAAFAKHYSLVLSPDDIWLCIAQGFATHVSLHAKELRDRFVRHEDRARIVVRRDHFEEGYPSNDWPGCFREFSDEIGKHVGKTRDLVVADFSTSGPIERAASEIVLMSSMQTYFQYAVRTLCGIPAITLLGTSEDWHSICGRAQNLAEFGLSAWVDVLLPVLEQFARVAAGESADVDFWRSFYKRRAESGGPYVTGWINVLFPYLEIEESDLTDTPRRVIEPNPHLSTWRDGTLRARGPQESDFPSGMSRAPFTWEYLDRLIPMTFFGGFVGVSQEPITGALRPVIGWAVQKASEVSDG